jgi:hypothetical protein
MKGLRLVPCSLDEANAFVSAQWKRRGRPSVDDRNPIGDKRRWVTGEKCDKVRPAFPVVTDVLQNRLPLDASEEQSA